MNNPKIIGIILSYPINIESLKMRKKLTINAIEKASAYIFKEYIYKDYFRSLLKEKKSNDYFSGKDIILDKMIFDNIIKFIKKDSKNEKNRYFIINESLIQDYFKLLSRLEMLGFLVKIDSRLIKEPKRIFKWQKSNMNLQGLYYLNYGAYIEHDIPFILNETIDDWSNNIDQYDITSELIEVLLKNEYYKCQNFECGKIWSIASINEIMKQDFICENCNNGNIKKEGSFDIPSLFNKNELAYKFLKEKDDFDQILTQLDEDQLRIIHTLYLNKDLNKGWMTTNEIGIFKRVIPFQLPHIRIIRIIRTINSLGKAKYLINETEKGKKLYRISNMGILFEEYCLWKLSIQNFNL